MALHLLAGNPPVEVLLRRSARARRLSLRVSRLDGRVTLTMPARAPEREAIAFLQDRESWLRMQLSGIRPSQSIAMGAQVMVEGASFTIAPAAVRSARQHEGQLLVPRDPGRTGTAVKAYLKVLARDRLAAASDRYAAAVGRSYSQLALRDTRSRWGSCSSAGVLMYSWRLIMAPPAVLDYVAAHEVAHLVEMNHSQAYWDVVDRIYPGYEKQRAWLRHNGTALHRVIFD